MKRNIATLFMVTAVSFIVKGQFDLTGTITDSLGAPLPAASVYIGNSFQGTVSDGRGRYRISNLRAGDYTVGVSYMGYEAASKKIRIDGDARMDFVLVKANFVADEVTVNATRADARSPVAWTDVEKEEIEKRNMGKDLPYLLSLTPSLVATSYAGTGIGYSSFRLRGTDLNRINVTVNGIPLNDAESHGVWFVDLPDLASSVQDIQIQRGVGTSTNGAAAFGASLNFRTNERRALPYARWDASAGSFRTIKNTVSAGTGLIGDHLEADIRLSSITSDGYVDRASSALRSIYLSAAWYGRKNLFRFNIISGQEKTYTAWNGIPGDSLGSNRTYNPAGMMIDANGNISYYDDEADNYKQDHYQLFFSREVGRYLTVNAALHYTHGTGYYEEYRDTAVWLAEGSDESYASYGLPNVVIGGVEIDKTNLVRQKWLDNDFYGFIWSLDYAKESLDLRFGGGLNEYDGRHFGKIIWARFPSWDTPDYEWYRGTGLKYDGNAYLKANYRMLRSLNVFGDMQVRYIRHEIGGIHDDLRNIAQEHEYLFLNPKFGLLWSPVDRYDLYLSFAMAGREPNRSNFIYADPAHPAPSQEVLMDYELGYRGRFPDLELGVNLYYMDYKDQLVLTGEINDVGAPIMTNIPESYRTGIELTAGWHPVDDLLWKANVTLSRNKIRQLTAYVDNWDYWTDPASEPYQVEEDLGETDISFSPSVTASGIISWNPLEGLTSGIETRYVGSQYIDNTSSPERSLDPYLLNDLFLSYRTELPAGGDITFRFRLNNVLNELYVSDAWVYRYYAGGSPGAIYGYYPQAGRNFMLGFSLGF